MKILRIAIAALFLIIRGVTDKGLFCCSRAIDAGIAETGADWETHVTVSADLLIEIKNAFSRYGAWSIISDILLILFVCTLR